VLSRVNTARACGAARRKGKKGKKRDDERKKEKKRGGGGRGYLDRAAASVRSHYMKLYAAAANVRTQKKGEGGRREKEGKKERKGSATRLLPF